MKLRLKSFWSLLLNPQTPGKVTYLQAIKSRLLSMQLVLVVVVVLFFLFQGLVHGDQDVVVSVTVLLLTAILLVLNNRGYYKIARFGWVVMYPLLIVFLTYVYGEELRSEFAYFGFTIGTLIFYDEKWVRIGVTILIIGLFVATNYFYSNFESPFADFVYSFDKVIMFIVSVVCVAIVLIVFYNENVKQHEEQLLLSEQLKQQNEQLLQLVSEKKEANQALQQSKGQLEQSNANLIQFAYIASHDLKTPLRNISNFVDLLSRKLKHLEDPDLKDYLNYIKAGTKKMHHQVEAVLETSRYQHAELQLGKVDIHQLLEQVITLLEPFIQQKRAQVSWHGMPQIIGDAQFLEKLFLNLIENGIKYNQSERPVIRITFEEDTIQYTFCVADNGIGIAPEYYDQVFKIFKRLPAPEHTTGTGIGLASCKQIVTLHDGEIWIEPIAQGGSQFKFTISKTLNHTDRYAVAEIG